MNDVGGSDSGTGLRAVKSSRTSDTNFEYDDEWDVGIGNLISDLDADIEKNNEATRTGSSPSNCSDRNSSRTSSPGTQTPLVPPTSPSTTVSPQMHIPRSPVQSSTSTNSNTPRGKSSSVGSAHSSTGGKKVQSTASTDSLATNSLISVSMEHSGAADKSLKMKIKRTKPGTKSVEAKHEIVKSDIPSTSANTSSSVSIKNSCPNESKCSSSPTIASSQKIIKDKGTVETKDIDIGTEQGATNKAKTPKRASTHKKAKPGTPNSALPNTSGTSNKKDLTGTDPKAFTPSSPTPTAGKIGNSPTKDVFSNNNVSSSTACTIVSSSAFVKASSSATSKVPAQIGILGHDLLAGATGSPNTGLSSRSPHHVNSSIIPSQFGHGSAVPVSAKGDKGNQSPSVAHAINANSDKLGTATSFAKKPRIIISGEKNATSPEDSTQLLGIGAGAAFTTGYRNLSVNSGYSNSPGNELGSSLSTLPHGVSVGAGNNEIPQHTGLEQVGLQDVCVGTTVGTVTEPDCLGPCEPGTSVTLEGIVWHETESGVLVVNVTWRGKTYVGTLLDCTKNDWASPRFCDSPTSDLEMRTPKNRGKRGRAQTATPVSDPGASENPRSSTKLRNGAKGRRGGSANAAFIAPVSPLKSELSKRKTRGSETEGQEEAGYTSSKNMKKIKLTKDSGGNQSNSHVLAATAAGNLDISSSPYSPALIECPEPNCSKKYKHINGLRYHQSHAHSNHFVPEDSDSNMSSASTTNLNNAHESLGASAELGKVEDSRVDGDLAESSQSTFEPSSAPATPVKKESLLAQLPRKESELEVADTDLNIVKEAEVDVGLPVPTKLLTTNIESKADAGRYSERDDVLEVKEIGISPSVVTKTPILTVPTLPFISLQNRTPAHGHVASLSRVAQDSGDTLFRNREHENLVSKSGSGISNISIPISANVPKGGVPWQPHVHAQAAPIQGHAAHVVSSLHPAQNLSIPNPLNMCSGAKDQERGHKEGLGSSTGSSGKKPKHKKKKEKGERERDGKPRSEGRDVGKGVFSGNPAVTNYLGAARGKDRSERRGNGREVSRNETNSAKRDSDGAGGNSGENRDDPQSPAYSDISDANDSGPESDAKPSSKETVAKCLPAVTELKKDGGSVGQNIPPFYSPFYSPHSLDSPYVNPSPNTGPNSQIKLERPSPSGTTTGDEPNAEKVKLKPIPTLPQHLQGHMEERRSPKMDYHPKYLPPQQHYYPYPYANYHYEQPPYGLMPEHAYNSHRGMVEEKERDALEERGRMSGKVRSAIDSNTKEEAGSFPNISVKQEQDRERGSKNPRSHALADEKQSQQPDFPTEYSGSEGKRHGHGLPHFTPTSKHSKESRRERDERHGGKESEGKELGKGRSSQDQSSRHKSTDSGNLGEKDKDSKNEGAKPTMETQGPPPPPTAGSYAYIPPGYLQGGPFGLPFDPNHPLYRQVMVPSPYPGSPYMHPGNIPRFSQPPGSTPLPEDLSRPSGNVGGAASKALDLLQHHAAQYYASHKIHELQERALKSPSPQIGVNQNNSAGSSGPGNLSSTPSSPSGLPPQGRATLGPAPLGLDRKSSELKETKASLTPLSTPVSGSESSRSPPIHHVHTHMHSHTHIGYPIIPTVPPQYSPHYGVLSTPPSGTPSVLPPFSSQKPA